MPFPSWRSAARFEPSSALVLLVIGLAGFLVDLLLKPVSLAGLALLMLAATPALVALFRRRPLEAGLAAAAPAKAALRAAAPEGPSASPDRSIARSKPEPGRQAPAKTSPARPMQPDQPRTPVPARAQLQVEAEPVRMRAEAQIGSARRPVEPARVHPNAL